MDKPWIRNVKYASTRAGVLESVAQDETNPKICGYAGLACLRRLRKTSRNLAGLSFIQICLICVLSTCCCSNSRGIGFKVTGKISSFNYSNGKPIKTTNSWTFELEVFTNTYLYKVALQSGQVVIFGCNGQDSYCLIQDSDGKQRLKMPGYIGYVFNGTYPAWSYCSATALPWLAFCSGPQLISNQTNDFVNLPAPWLSSFAMLWAHLYKVRYLPLEHGFGLPTRLEYIIDPDKYESIRNGFYETVSKPKDRERDAVLLKLGAFRNVSDPEAIYHVDQTTNCSGIVLPLAFTFDRYTIHTTPSHSIVREPFNTFKGELTSIELIGSFNPLPSITDNTTNIQVSDYRFANEDNGVIFLSYFSANVGGWITNKSNVSLQTLYAKDVAKRKSVLSVNMPRSAVIGLLFVVTIIPMICFVKQGNKRPAADSDKL